MNIIYQSRTESWVNQPKICNTNNHKVEDQEPGFERLEDISSDEYRRRLCQTNKNVWVKIFSDPEGTITIPLSISQCKILADASKIGFLTNERSTLFKEELDEIEFYISSSLKGSKIVKWFIRLNEASPKDGRYGCGPLMSAKEMVTSLATSVRAHRAFLTSLELNQPNILYLVPWREDWNEFLEFRVFIHKRRVTCFSQYIWHRDLGWNASNIAVVAPRIIDYCDNSIIPKVDLESFVVDVTIVIPNPTIINENKIPVIIDDTSFSIEVVELNSFGAELASGAALFHWLNDYNIMYGTHNNVVVRYISE
ncbi:Hypothetical protein HVR_LOCUS181 [uncultured virus]|nr:Hypothetical protein HVR_LOCUS181 [uncultured virus]